MIFPYIPHDSVPPVAADSIGRAPEFDFEKKQFVVVDGAIKECSGREAVQQWFNLMMRQKIDQIPIYRTTGSRKIGLDMDVLSGRLQTGYAEAEIERNVRETASFNPAVRAIQDFRFSSKGHMRIIEFTAVLHTGESVEVSTNV